MSRVGIVNALSAFIFVFFSSVGMAEGAAEVAAEEAALPGQVITEATTALLATVKEKTELLNSEPEKYFAEVRDLLEPVIDFPSIAKQVMGSEVVAAADGSKKQRKYRWDLVSSEDQQRFVEQFTDSLVRTYGKAMSSFADLEVKVVKTWPSDNPKKKNYYVQQDVKLEGGLAHIVYTMYPLADGWKVRNIVIADSKGYKVNLGKTFFKQFKYELGENDGDVVATINGWGKE